MCCCLHSKSDKYSTFFHVNSFVIIEITGNPHVGFKEEDIEGDFDPKKYDEAMQVFLKQVNVKVLFLIKNKFMNQK